MSNMCVLRGDNIAVSPNISLKALEKAIIKACKDGGASVEPAEIKAMFHEPDDDNYLEVDRDGVLWFRLETRGQGGYLCEAADAFVAALSKYVTEPGFFRFIDTDMSPESEEATTVYALGRTPQERELSRVMHGLELASEFWNHLGTDFLEALAKSLVRRNAKVAKRSAS